MYLRNILVFTEIFPTSHIIADNALNFLGNPKDNNEDFEKLGIYETN